MTVFANGLEISAKKQGCKIVAAFPDTCFTPPQTPATPPGVPVPYPNFATDCDLTKGTGTVTIGGETVSQENASRWSKVTGDEAGSAPKKGIITSNNLGAAYAKKWSMNVKFEGKGVVRFTDLATTNHASEIGQTPTALLIALLSQIWSRLECFDCGDGNHVEEIILATPPEGETDTDQRISRLGDEAIQQDNEDKLFEAAGAEHNRAEGHLSPISGGQISGGENGNTDDPDNVIARCTICGKKREIDHIMDNGNLCEVKNQRSGQKKHQKLNNYKYAQDNSVQAVYKVPSNIFRESERHLMQYYGFDVIRIPGWNK